MFCFFSSLLCSSFVDVYPTHTWELCRTTTSAVSEQLIGNLRELKGVEHGSLACFKLSIAVKNKSDILTLTAKNDVMCVNCTQHVYAPKLRGGKKAIEHQ